MGIFKLLRSYKEAREISKLPREKVLEIQKARLEETLSYAYDNCPFYRELWQKAGINKENLLKTPLDNFPTVTKREIMENFEKIVTQKINLQKVERFLSMRRIWNRLFKRKYIILHTSGSSGYIGIFLFTKEFWDRQLGALAARIVDLPLRSMIFRRTRIAFAGEAVGPHASKKIVNSAPGFLLKVWSLKPEDPMKKLIKSLNRFRPEILTGFAGTLSMVADLQIKGDIRIKPNIVISSSEPLNPTRRDLIKKAFGVDPINWYGSTECLALAVQPQGQDKMNVFDDIVIMQSMDAAGRPKPDGESGRAVITVLGNKIQPLIRYVLNDEVTVATESKDYPFRQMDIVGGRTEDRLVLILDSGQKIVIHQVELVGLFVPGLVQFQIIQTSPKGILVKAVLHGDRGKITRQLRQFCLYYLKRKSIRQPEKEIDLKIEAVESIPPEPKTNKTPILIPLATSQSR